MRAFIFGAGASKAEGAPTTKDLLPSTINEFPNDDQIYRVKKFLSDVFYIDFNSNNIKYPSFEDVLNLIDASIIEQRDLSKEYDFRKLEDLRDAFIYSIAKIIQKSLEHIDGNIHRNFIRKIFTSNERNQLNTSFINLNYDILLDNALIPLLNRNIDIDYCIDFRNSDFYENLPPNINDRTTQQWHKPRIHNAMYLLKPHGSLNWLYCPNCQTIKITPKEKGALKIFTEYTTCENDGSRQRPVVVAPTWHKNYSNPHMSAIWLKAGQILRQAKEVIFIGYSLPEADHRLRYLFKKNIWRQNVNNVPKIHVVTGSENSESIKRYQTLFGPEINFHTDGFESFVNEYSDELFI